MVHFFKPQNLSGLSTTLRIWRLVVGKFWFRFLYAFRFRYHFIFRFRPKFWFKIEPKNEIC